MGMRAKAAGVLIVVSGLLVTGLAMASSKKKSKPAAKDEDLELEEDDVIATAPTDDGGEADIIIDSKDVEELEEVLPETINDVVSSPPGGSTPIDGKLQEEAAKEGIREQDAIKDVIKEVTQGEGSSPLGAEETTPQMDPYGTVSLARLLLAREEMPGWKADLTEEIKEWQREPGIGLTDDGKFGPKSLGKMAMEVGILPLIRYYPSSVTTKAQGIALAKSEVKKAINALQAELPDSQAQIDALTLSMGREKAQSMGTNNPPAQPTREFVQSVNDAIAEAAETETEKELASNA